MVLVVPHPEVASPQHEWKQSTGLQDHYYGGGQETPSRVIGNAAAATTKKILLGDGGGQRRRLQLPPRETPSGEDSTIDSRAPFVVMLER